MESEVIKHIDFTSTDFQYELGLSFLSIDEQVAKKLHDILCKQTSVYFYRNEKRQQAFDNAPTLYNQIFSKKVRIPIILSRKGWGDHGITHVEELAIQSVLTSKGRGINHIFIIKMDEYYPDWYAPNIYENYLNNEEIIAGIILHRLKQVDGKITSITPEDKINEQFELDKFRRKRDDYLKNDINAITEAIDEYEHLYDLLKDKVVKNLTKYNLSGGFAIIDRWHPSGNGYTPMSWFGNENGCIAVGWRTIYDNSLEGNILYTHGGDMFNAKKISFEDISKDKYTYTFNKYEELGWALLGQPDSFFTSEEIINKIFAEFVDVFIANIDKKYNNK